MLSRAESDIYFNNCISITQQCNRIIDASEFDKSDEEVREQICEHIKQIRTFVGIMERNIEIWSERQRKLFRR